MKHNISSFIGVLTLSVGLSSCADQTMEPDLNPSNGKVEMAFTFSHPSQLQSSRATETSFEKGDVVGLYVSQSGNPLEVSGNTVNNQALTFTGSEWTASRKLYWDDGQFDVFAYYPYTDVVSSISDFPFEVALDQRGNQVTVPNGYESSDFLFASAKTVTASANPVNMQFRHIMSKVSVRLIKGEDYEGDIPDNATVYLHNTVTSAGIDLSVGVATKNPRGQRHTITAHQNGTTSFSAIVVPQRLENRVPLIEVVMNGVSFLYESKFVFKPGVHHLVNLVVDKNPEQIKIEIGGEITDWN